MLTENLMKLAKCKYLQLV